VGARLLTQPPLGESRADHNDPVPFAPANREPRPSEVNLVDSPRLAAPHMAAYGARTKDMIANRAVHILTPA